MSINAATVTEKDLEYLSALKNQLGIDTNLLHELVQELSLQLYKRERKEIAKKKFSTYFVGPFLYEKAMSTDWSGEDDFYFSTSGNDKLEHYFYIHKSDKDKLIKHSVISIFKNWLRRERWMPHQFSSLLASVSPSKVRLKRNEVYGNVFIVVDGPKHVQDKIHDYFENIRYWPLYQNNDAPPFHYINYALKKNIPVPEELLRLAIEQFKDEYSISSDYVEQSKKSYPHLAKEAKIGLSKLIDAEAANLDSQTTRERKKEEKYKVIIAAFIKLLAQKNPQYKHVQAGASHNIDDPNFSEISKGIESYLCSGNLEEIKDSNGKKLGLTGQALRKLFTESLKLHQKLCEDLSKLD